MKVTFLGLSITSSWGNGHATNYRALVKALAERGHDVVFLERDVPWYASHRDLPRPPHGRTFLYSSLDELRSDLAEHVASAGLVVVGSFVPDGVAVGQWVLDAARGVTAFYDIATPVTLEKLEQGDYEYLSPELVAGYDLYLSFTGGPVLEVIRTGYGAARPRPFYCLVDASEYRPEAAETRWDLGYLGTYSDDRQPAVDRLLVEPARRMPEARFAVAGPQYPETIEWPGNVERIDHLPPGEHRRFYNSQRFTLNVTREQMVRTGYAPSVRLFEAAACGVPIVSDWWEGLDAFFVPGSEILIARDSGDVVRYLRDVSDDERRSIAEAARRRVLAEHTAERRAEELEAHAAEAAGVRGAVS